MGKRFLRYNLFDKDGAILHLSLKKKSKIGRSGGRIACRHKFRGHKKQVRCLDTYRTLWNIMGKVIKFDFNSLNRSFIALVSYSIGFLSYIPATYGCRINSSIYASSNLKEKFKAGNATFLAAIPIQRRINSLEIRPASGSKYLKSPGSFGKLTKKNLFFSWIKLRSGSFIKISNLCFASIGTIRLAKYNLSLYNKRAGLARLIFGRRPVVRGVAKNPVDHPHGGGEGKKSGKSVSMSPWGKLIKGRKTARKKIN